MMLVEDPPLIRSVRVVDPENQIVEVTWKGGPRVGKEDTIDLSEALESRRHYYRLLLSRPALFKDISVVDGGRAIAWFNASITMSAEVIESLVPKRRVTDLAKLYAGDGTAPLIIGLIPDHGDAGITIIIKGANFTGATQILFGTTIVTTFTVIDDQTISLVAPITF